MVREEGRSDRESRSPTRQTHEYDKLHEHGLGQEQQHRQLAVHQAIQFYVEWRWAAEYVSYFIILIVTSFIV